MTRPPDATAGGRPRPGPPGGPRAAYRPPVPPGRGFVPPPQRRLSPSQGSRLGLIAGLIVVLGAAAGLVLSFFQPTMYAARTDIQYVVSQENASDFLRTDRNLTTQTVVLTSRSVLGPVAEANGISPDDLASRVTAQPVMAAAGVASEIIQVQVLDRSRDTGVKLADDIGKQYLKVFNESGPKAYIQAQLDEARRELATASGANAAALQARVTTLQGQLDTENIAGNQASIVVAPYSVTAPAEPQPLLAAATGGLLGIVIAALVVLALSRRWTRS